MNKKQIKVPWAGVFWISLMALFPPWVGTRNDQIEGYIGHHFAFGREGPKYRQHHPPTRVTRVINGWRVVEREEGFDSWQHYRDCRIDLGRFVLQVIPVALVAGGLVLSFADKSTPNRKEQMAQS